MQTHNTRPNRIAILRNRSLRFALGALVVSLFLLAPSAVQAGQTASYNAHCKRITKQIDRYEGVAEMARERDNDAWLAGTLKHIERLETRRDRLCPSYADELAKAENEQFWKDTYALTKQIAQGAVKYFTLGAY
jgi:hypothetical protein